MKRLPSNSTSLFASVLAGMLLCLPATGFTEVLRGKIVAVDVAQGLLTLVNSANTTTISVVYTEKTALCGHGKGMQRGCCMRPGRRVEIEGAFSTGDATLFSATVIRGDHGSRPYDPTGVRSRLHSCTAGALDPQ